jgi:hypothetical protein
MKLSVPEDDSKIVKTWLLDDNASFPALLDALKQAKPALQRSELVKQVVEKSGIGAEQVEEVLGVLFNLVQTAAKWHEAGESTPFLPTLFHALNGPEPVDADKLQRFTARAGELLSLKVIEVTSKALAVQVENSKIFCDARVVSELRPVFSDSDSDGIKAEAAVIVHQLKLVFHTGGDYDRDAVFISCDRGDLVALKKVLDRAIAKHDSLVQIAKPLQVLE